MNRPTRHAFSLTDTVNVILLLGIVVTLAAPRLWDRTTAAEQAITRRQLSVLRQAIAIYEERTGSYPPIHALPASLDGILQGPFPAPVVGSARGDHGVYYDSDDDADKPVQPDPDQPGGWAYKPANGALQLNLGASEIGADW